MTTLYAAAWLIPDSETPPIRDGAVAVDGDRLVALGPIADLQTAYPDAALVRLGNRALMPGLINSHHHIEAATHQQQAVEDDLLEPWLLAQAKLRAIDPYLTAAIAGLRLLASGITTVYEVHSFTGTAEAYRESILRALAGFRDVGIRVIFATGVTTQNVLVHGPGEDAEFAHQAVGDAHKQANRRLKAKRPSPAEYFAMLDGLRPGIETDPLQDLWFAPPGPVWVDDAFLVETARAAETHDAGFQTHVSESQYEKLYGPLAYGKPTVLHLRDLGILSDRFSIAHGVWLNAAEIEALAETGAAAVHNPSSNLRLRAGVMPLNAYLAAGVTVGLGLDGTTLDDDDDMFREMRLALRLHRTPSVDGPAPGIADVFRMATENGARICRRGDEIGRLATGMAADFIAVDLDRLSWPWVAPDVDVRHLIVQRAQARDVVLTVVAGRVVWQEGSSPLVDVGDLGARAAEALAQAPANEPPHALIEAVRGYYRRWA